MSRHFRCHLKRPVLFRFNTGFRFVAGNRRISRPDQTGNVLTKHRNDCRQPTIDQITGLGELQLKSRQQVYGLLRTEPVVTDHPVIDRKKPKQLTTRIHANCDEMMDGSLTTFGSQEAMKMPVLGRAVFRRVAMIIPLGAGLRIEYIVRRKMLPGRNIRRVTERSVNHTFAGLCENLFAIKRFPDGLTFQIGSFGHSDKAAKVLTNGQDPDAEHGAAAQGDTAAHGASAEHGEAAAQGEVAEHGDAAEHGLAAEQGDSSAAHGDRAEQGESAVPGDVSSVVAATAGGSGLMSLVNWSAPTPATATAKTDPNRK